MTANSSPRTPWMYISGALLAVLAAGLITFTDLAWRGIIGWTLLLVALLLMVAGGLTWRRQRELGGAAGRST